MELTDEQRLAVQFLAVDMHDGFISSARELCPNAKIAVDRFYLVQKLNEKFDEVRKEELAKMKKQKEKHEFLKGMLSGSKRFILVEREKSKLPQSDLDDLEKLKMLNENINTAMILTSTSTVYSIERQSRASAQGLRSGSGWSKPQDSSL